MSTGTYVPVKCAGCHQPIMDASFIWTGTGMYHNHCRPAGHVTFAPTTAPSLTADDVRRIVREELQRALGVMEAHLAAAKERADEYADWFLTNARKDGVAMPDSSALIDAAFKHSDLYEGREIPANETRAAINNAFFAGATFATRGVAIPDGGQRNG